MIPDLIRYILMIIGGLCIGATLFIVGVMITGHFYDKHKDEESKELADSDFDKIWGWDDEYRD